MKTSRGSIRRSQVITTYGPGALIDLPRDSAIVGGLDLWPRPDQLEVIDEPRLAERLRRLTDGALPQLCMPPAASDRPGPHSPRIRSPRFPGWRLVQESAAPGGSTGPSTTSRRLVHRSHLDDRGRFDGKPVVPIRFVRACPHGHVDDIDWYDFVHEGASNCRGELRLEEQGTGGDLANLVLYCSCGSRRRMIEAMDRAQRPLGYCGGRRPWLGPGSREDCTRPSRLLIRTATNAWFPQVVTVLSLPQGGSNVDRAVEEQWSVLQIVQETDHVALTRGNPQVAAALEPFGDEEVFLAVERRRQGARTDRPAKLDELDALLAAPEGFGDDVPVDERFHARRLPRRVWQARGAGPPRSASGGMPDRRIHAVIQVHRLREVAALAGFTRFEAEAADIYGEYESDVARAALASEPSWFPAIENRGEGVFLALDGDAVRQWQDRPAVTRRCAELEAGHRKWLEKFQGQKKRDFPGGPYILLHTLSHLLIGSLALRCGYPAASLRERIYVDQASSRYGLLLYTASPDAEGTLGGLVQQARRLASHLDHALRAAALCSNDPICAAHVPNESREDRLLHGAACHACTLIAETSCEMRNDYLDRALVAQTLDSEPGTAFFDQTD